MKLNRLQGRKDGEDQVEAGRPALPFMRFFIERHDGGGSLRDSPGNFLGGLSSGRMKHDEYK
jgi:hypothetical protein